MYMNLTQTTVPEGPSAVVGSLLRGHVVFLLVCLTCLVGVRLSDL